MVQGQEVRTWRYGFAHQTDGEATALLDRKSLWSELSVGTDLIPSCPSSDGWPQIPRYRTDRGRSGGRGGGPSSDRGADSGPVGSGADLDRVVVQVHDPDGGDRHEGEQFQRRGRPPGQRRRPGPGGQSRRVRDAGRPRSVPGPGNDDDIGLVLTAEPRRAAGEREGRVPPLDASWSASAGQAPFGDLPAAAAAPVSSITSFTSSPSRNISLIGIPDIHLS